MQDVTCSIGNCVKPRRYVSTGWCTTHYERWRLRGSTDDPRRPSFEERLWSYVDKSGGCWVWTGNLTVSGYGQIETRDADGGRLVLVASRATWALANGPIPSGLEVCHHCDNPPCVRPDHLFLGTHADNMRDMARKGRVSKHMALPEAELQRRYDAASPKWCPRCEQTQPPSAFGPNRARRDGLQSYCIPCNKAYMWKRRERLNDYLYP